MSVEDKQRSFPAGRGDDGPLLRGVASNLVG